jgi:hypothetical protein
MWLVIDFAESLSSHWNHSGYYRPSRRHIRGDYVIFEADREGMALFVDVQLRLRQDYGVYV